MKLLTKPQVVEMMKISPRTLDNYMAAGQFPKPVRIGKRLLRWIVEDLEEWIHEQPRR